jgi:hypothetical protein
MTGSVLEMFSGAAWYVLNSASVQDGFMKKIVFPEENKEDNVDFL